MISRDLRILTLLDDARKWLALEGAFGVHVSMDTDLGVFGEVCASMVVISVDKWVDVTTRPKRTAKIYSAH